MAVGAHHGRLDLLLAEVGQNIVHGELSLGDTDGQERVAAGRGAEEREGQLVHVVVVVQPGLGQRLVELLQLGRHDAVAQIHGSWEFCMAR